MIGALIGAGLGAASSIYGGITASKAMKALQDSINKRKEEDQNWYEKNYNQDPTQRASAQRLITQLNDSIKERNKAAADTEAVMGGTGEQSARAREDNNKAIADVTSAINAQGDARQDAIDKEHRATQSALDQEGAALQAGKAQAIAQAVQGVGQAAGNIGVAVDGSKTNVSFDGSKTNVSFNPGNNAYLSPDDINELNKKV